MYRAAATVITDRAVRYRDQLASHGAGLKRHAGSSREGHAAPIVDSSNTDGTLVLTLARGRCTISAVDDALHLIAEAETLEDLERIQAGVSNRITKIGRRDHLTVTWTPIEEHDSPAAENAQHSRAFGRRLLTRAHAMVRRLH